MAEVLRYINTDVVGGAGDGKTLADAYSSRNAWQSAENTDLVTATDNHVVLCSASSGTADSTASNISTWVTSSLYDLVIKGADTDKAVKTGVNTGIYRFTGGTSFVSVAYITFQSFQVVNSRIQFTGGTGLYYFDKMYIEGVRIEARSAGATGDITVTNSIFYNSAERAVWTDNAVTISLYNSIFYGNNTSEGIRNDAATTSIIKNCAVFNWSDDFNIGGTNTIDYCASDDGDGTNAVAPSGADWANEFSNVSAGNFTLVTGGNCEGGGTNDPGSGLYSTDMDGDAYTSPWSIGVDAKTASGGGLMPQIQKNNLGNDLFNGTIQ